MVSVQVCEKELNGKFPDDAILKAFSVAWKEYPNFFPTVGQLEILCREGRRPRSQREKEADDRASRHRMLVDETAKREREEAEAKDAEEKFKREHPEEWAKREAERNRNADKFFAECRLRLNEGE